MTLVAIWRRKYLSWLTAISEPSNCLTASSSISLEGMSRWLVGSSSTRKVAGDIMNLARASLAFSPPLSTPTCDQQALIDWVALGADALRVEAWQQPLYKLVCRTRHGALTRLFCPERTNRKAHAHELLEGLLTGKRHARLDTNTQCHLAMLFKIKSFDLKSLRVCPHQGGCVPISPSTCQRTSCDPTGL